MNVLTVEGLTKRYSGFALDDVSFTLGEGRIMGLIGRNGAGKTTALKSILGMIKPQGGRITVLGHELPGGEAACKQEMGVVLGGIDFYMQKRLSDITSATRRFYPAWDAGAYSRHMARFGLDEHKRVNELSAGMRVKYLIALALSHGAGLLILDEPTSGLDPVARDELLELLRHLADSRGISVLFSTHITSDLDKCADDITYIKDGRVLASGEKATFARHFLHLRQPGETGELSLEEIMLRTERRTYDDF